MRVLAKALVLALLVTVLSMHAEYRSAVLVLPLRAAPGLAPSETAIGVGIQVVLENMLAAEGSLDETWAEDDYPRLFGSADEFHRWLSDAHSAMPSAAPVAARYLVSGTIGREGNRLLATLVVLDRQSGKQTSSRIEADFPELKGLRLALLGLLEANGVPAVTRDNSVVWKEALSAECLSLLGDGVSTAALQLWSDAGVASVPQPLIAAAAGCPASYVAQATLAWQQTQARAAGNGTTAGSAAKKLNSEGVRASEWLLEAAFRAFRANLVQQAADSIMRVRGGRSAFDRARLDYWVGRIEFMRGDIDEAERRLRESIKLNPRALDPHLALAQVSNRRNHLMVEGQEILKAAAAIFPDAYDQKRLKAADEQMGMLALADVGFLMGIDFEANGDWKNAEESYGLAAKVHRGRDLADAAVDHISLAELRESLGQTKEAAADRAAAKTMADALPTPRPLANSMAYRARHILRAGNLGKAEAAARSALEQCRAAGDAKCEWDILNATGLALLDKGYVDKAIEDLEAAFQVRAELNDPKVDGIAKNNLGLAYRAAGRLPEALDYLKQAYQARTKANDAEGLRRTVQNLSVVYGDMGKYDDAVKESRHSFQLARDGDDKSGQVTALYTLGSFLTKVNDSAEAIKVLEDALSLSREIKDHHDEGVVLNNLATAKTYAGQDGKPMLEQSLKIARSEGNWQDQMTRLANFGAFLFAEKKTAEAETYFQRALAFATGVRDQIGEARILTRLMVVTRDRPRLALWYGKRAAGIIGSLGPSLFVSGSFENGSDLNDFFDPMIDLLVRQGSLAEAQEVLDIRSMAEQARVANPLGGGRPRKLPPSLLSPEEEAAFAQYDNLVKAWFALEQESAEPKSTRPKEVVTREADAAHQKIDAYLAKITKDYGERPAVRSPQVVAPESRVGNLSAKAVIRTLPGDRFRAIVETERGSTVVTGDIEIRTLNQKIFEFRQALLDPRRDPIPLAQELYRAVFLPVKPVVEDAKATTLLWSVQGALRYLPIAALHDGREYLVAHYRNIAYAPSASPRSGADTSGARILAAGVSGAGHGFRALPYVEEELRAIVRSADSPGGALPGLTLLNSSFTWQELQSQLAAGFPLVHIATHFRFRPENPRASELLLGTGLLRLDQLQAAQGIFEKVELLVLSGCETGSPGGDDSNEVDALSAAVLTLGARSVVASLWQVADRSTSELMATFYRRYAEHGDPARALQQAQAAMVQKGGSTAHPYYWAPFFLSAGR
jgi:CHAT domain-containing protein/Tfp pilus assembly protein PilF